MHIRDDYDEDLEDDDAAKKGQHHRADLFNELLAGLTEGEAS